MYRSRTFFALAVLSALVAGAWAQVLPDRHSRRAKPPRFPESVRDAFFDDASKELVGPRPAYGVSADPKADFATNSSKDEPPAPHGFAWSRLIRAETLEDEIKLLQMQTRESIESASKFKSGGYKESRRYFSELAVLFAIIAEFDENVRWKDQATGMRDLTSRTSRQCKVGTDASFTAAMKTKNDLEQLVQGGNVSVAKADVGVKWSEVVDRPPLMQYFESSQQHGIGPAIANGKEFSKRSSQLEHAGELVAALAEVIQREGFDFTDDEAYLKHARRLRDQAQLLVESAKKRDYGGARAAAGEIEKACAACHEGYRD